MNSQYSLTTAATYRGACGDVTGRGLPDLVVANFGFDVKTPATVWRHASKTAKKKPAGLLLSAADDLVALHAADRQLVVGQGCALDVLRPRLAQ